jgi:ribonuclease BN (tRNA processing enzyme)
METAFPGSSGAAQKFALELVEIAAGETLAVGAIGVSAFQALHGPPGGPYLSVRVEAEGRSVTYTGDTEWTPELIPAARGADLFIAEAYFRDRTIATHLSLDAIEANLAEMRPKRLVLTHMSDDMLGHPDRALYETAEDGLVIAIA